MSQLFQVVPGPQEPISRKCDDRAGIQLVPKHYRTTSRSGWSQSRVWAQGGRLFHFWKLETRRKTRSCYGRDSSRYTSRTKTRGTQNPLKCTNTVTPRMEANEEGNTDTNRQEPKTNITTYCRPPGTQNLDRGPGLTVTFDPRGGRHPSTGSNSRIIHLAHALHRCADPSVRPPATARRPDERDGWAAPPRPDSARSASRAQHQRQRAGRFMTRSATRPPEAAAAWLGFQVVIKPMYFT